MNLSIITEYPIWFIIFCFGLAFIYAFVLYRKDKQFTESGEWKIRMMGAFRFLYSSVIAFLLLSPLIKTISRSIEKPIIIVAQDNSESLVISADSAFYRGKYSTDISNLSSQLSDKYEVRTYTFGDNLKKTDSFDFSDKQTNFSDLFNEIQNKFANRNVGALILASDGIYNKGLNPVYSAEDINFPVYTIALGDTAIQKDIILSRVKSNKIAFLGNIFPIQVAVDIKELKGITTELSVYSGTKKIFTKKIVANSNSYSETVNVDVEAKKSGIKRYKVQLSSHRDEINKRNNAKDIVIDIINAKQKILILANSPHPDVGAIRKTLNANPNYKVDFYTIDEFTKSVKEYNLVILHQVPSNSKASTQILAQITQSEVPLFFILGTQSAYSNLNNLNAGLNIQYSKGTFDQTNAEINEGFSLFELDNDIKELARSVPPLISPFGEYKTSASANVLFYQKIRTVATQKPLLFFDMQNDRKVCFLIGEGIWRWRMYDYLDNSSHELFNELINKIVQYLALRVNKDNFVITTKKIFNENEAIIIDAEVYNESFELVDNAEVSVEITNEEEKVFSFILNPQQNGNKMYSMNAGIFPVGDYAYKAVAKVGEKTYKKSGNFSVISINLEAINTIANHQLLYQLAAKKNGQMYYPSNLDSLIANIDANQNIIPVSYTEKNLKDLINIKWLFFVILVLISIEWFMRKYFGGY